MNDNEPHRSSFEKGGSFWLVVALLTFTAALVVLAWAALTGAPPF